MVGWGGMNKVVVVGLCIHKCEVGEGAGANHHKTEHNGSVSGVLIRPTILYGQETTTPTLYNAGN